MTETSWWQVLRPKETTRSPRGHHGVQRQQCGLRSRRGNRQPLVSGSDTGGGCVVAVSSSPFDRSPFTPWQVQHFFMARAGATNPEKSGVCAIRLRVASSKTRRLASGHFGKGVRRHVHTWAVHLACAPADNMELVSFVGVTPSGGVWGRDWRHIWHRRPDDAMEEGSASRSF